MRRCNAPADPSSISRQQLAREGELAPSPPASRLPQQCPANRSSPWHNLVSKRSQCNPGPFTGQNFSSSITFKAQWQFLDTCIVLFHSAWVLQRKPAVSGQGCLLKQLKPHLCSAEDTFSGIKKKSHSSQVAASQLITPVSSSCCSGFQEAGWQMGLVLSKDLRVFCAVAWWATMHRETGRWQNACVCCGVGMFIWTWTS